MLIAASGQAATAQTNDSAQDPASQHQVLLDMLNQRRADFGFKSVQPNSGLNALAQIYADSIVGRRSFDIEPVTFLGYPVLYGDIANSVGAEGYILRSHGLTLAFGIGAIPTFQSALDDDRNRPALLDNVMDYAGFGFGTVPAGPEWLVEPPGGGVAIDLTGYTVVVTITAGDF